MKEKQYAKLLIDVTKISTALNFHHSRVSEFSTKCTEYCTALINNLDSMQAMLQQSAEPDVVPKLIGSLDRIRASLKKDLETPALDYKKSIDKIERELNDKILPLIKSNTGATTFDLKPIIRTIEQSKPILLAIQQKVNTCFSEIAKCQSKIASFDQELQFMDLPNSIERATKHVEKVATELSGLQAQLEASPNKEQYKSAFLPLSAALSKLKLQGTEVEGGLAVPAPKASGPDLKPL